MDGLIIGLDLCDAYTQISCFGQEKSWTIPTVICKRKQTNEWHIGEDAYGLTLIGEGIIIDKLLKLSKKEGTATIECVKYHGYELLKLFLEKVLVYPKEEFQLSNIKCLVVTLNTVDLSLIGILQQVVKELGINQECIHIISHTESFIYYTLNQRKDLWNNQVGLFDLSEDGLSYYELKVQRGLRQMMVIAENQSMEEGFNLDILDTPSGIKLADKILYSCSERMLQNKVFSSIFLSGKGFQSSEWAGEFMKFVCSRRKVYMDGQIFSKGAVFKGVDLESHKKVDSFICICDGRLPATVSVPILHKDKHSQLVVASAGDCWYEARCEIDLIIDDQQEIEFHLVSPDQKNKKNVKIPLDGIPIRMDKTTRVHMKVEFLDGKTMGVEVADQGFGDFYPSSGVVVRQEVML